jgi:hypothetical protein
MKPTDNAKRIAQLIRHSKWSLVDLQWLYRHVTSSDIRSVVAFRIWELGQTVPPEDHDPR